MQDITSQPKAKSVGSPKYDLGNEADYRLVTAAREMLEALEAVRELLDDGFLVRNTKDDSDPAWAIKAFPKLRKLALIESAIRKAKGEL